MIDEKEVLKILKRYDGRMNPTAYFGLEADIVNIEALEQEPTTKNDLGVDDKERELALIYLEQIKEDYIEGVGYERHPLPEYYAIETAIKSLTMPSVTPQEPILDRVRAEIEQKLGTHGNISLYNRAIYDVLMILDKYKAETEE